MAVTDTKIWRQDPVTGAWKCEQTCTTATAHQWLLEAKKANPEGVFKISPTRPKG